jgi:bifunctional DNA-binding transcriptional regulator/antitoxin component of YhaV-PrlF toxin-antitoxin module
MMAFSTLTSKNQTTIPQAVVKALGIKPTDKLVFEIENGGVRLLAKTETFTSLLKKLPQRRKPASPVTIEKMNEVIAGRATGRFKAAQPVAS